MLSSSTRTSWWLAIVAMAAALLMGLARAPEPDPVPRRWQLDVKFDQLRLVNVSGRQYYFITYSVVNRSGQDLLFAPSFELVGSEDVNVRRSGRGVPAAVTSSLLVRLGNPLLEDQIGIIGMLQQGAENARQGLVIWPVENARPGALTLFASGFSGETAAVVPPGGEGKSVTLRKSQMLAYSDVGDLSLRGEGPLPLVESRWVMR